jgi:hypothetical protein
MNINIKPMKLTFVNNDDGTWSKILTDIDGRTVMQELNLLLLPEMMTKQYFDDWENQMKNSPITNIVEVERFL